MYTYLYTYFEIIFVYNFKWVICMGNLKISKKVKTTDSITRTIRISGEIFDKISAIAEKNNISFNSVVNQIIEYGLSNLED